MDPEAVMAACKEAEGRVMRGKRHVLYKCPAGKWTAGYGRNLEDNGLSDGEATLLLLHDVQDAAADLDRNAYWWRSMTQGRQNALCELCFALGWPRLSGFKRMLAALERGEYAAAAVELRESKFARQVGARADRIAEMLWKG